MISKRCTHMHLSLEISIFLWVIDGCIDRERSIKYLDERKVHLKNMWI